MLKLTITPIKKESIEYVQKRLRRDGNPIARINYTTSVKIEK